MLTFFSLSHSLFSLSRFLSLFLPPSLSPHFTLPPSHSIIALFLSISVPLFPSLPLFSLPLALPLFPPFLIPPFSLHTTLPFLYLSFSLSLSLSLSWETAFVRNGCSFHEPNHGVDDVAWATELNNRTKIGQNKLTPGWQMTAAGLSSSCSGKVDGWQPRVCSFAIWKPIRLCRTNRFCRLILWYLNNIRFVNVVVDALEPIPALYK